MNFIDVMWLIVFAYSLIQIALLLQSDGQTRVAIALPLLIMVPIFLGSVSAVPSSEPPTSLFVASSLALSYLVIVTYRSLPIPASMPNRLKATSRFR